MKAFLYWGLFLTFTIYWVVWMPLYIALETIALLIAGVLTGIHYCVDKGTEFDLKLARFHKIAFEAINSTKNTVSEGE